MYHRLSNPLKSNSFFLFGARGTGKSTLIQTHLNDLKVYTINLLDPVIEDRYLKNIKLFYNEVIQNKDQFDFFFIDEIQKIPELLNYCHMLIESHKIKFALTGSSARKLKRGAANLLAGRAFLNYLFPLTYNEMAKDFDLNLVLNWGSLPQILNNKNTQFRKEYLISYTLTYLNEEIKAEQIVRNLRPFRLFLQIAAQMNGELINYSKISSDVGSDYKTIQNFYQILEDTLVGFYLNPYHKSIRKRQRQHPKFYFFDLGVCKALLNGLDSPFIEGTYGYGKAFEHFVICEIFRLNEYKRTMYNLSYFQSSSQCEIDLILERNRNEIILIEIKSTSEVKPEHYKNLALYEKDFPKAKFILISRDETPQKIGKISALHYKDALKEIFS